jgi:hypothetical protein
MNRCSCVVRSLSHFKFVPKEALPDRVWY